MTRTGLFVSLILFAISTTLLKSQENSHELTILKHKSKKSIANALIYADSLNTNFNFNNIPKQRAEFFYEYSRLLISATNYNRAYQVIDKAEKIYRFSSDFSGLAKTNFIKGTVMLKTGHIDKAELIFLNLIKLQNRISDTTIIETYFKLVELYNRNENSVKAICYLDSIKERNPNREQLVSLLNTHAIILKNLGDFDASEVKITEAEKIAMELNLANHIATINGTKGSLYYSKRDYKKALQFHQKAYEYSSKISDTENIILRVVNISSCYFQIGKTEKAESMLTDITDTVIAANQKEILCTIYYNMGIYKTAQNNNSKAIDFFNKAKDIAKQLGSAKRLKDIYQQLSVIYSDKKEYKNAYWSILKSNHYNQKNNEAEIAKKITLHNYKHQIESERNMRANLLRDIETNRLINETIQRQNIYGIAALVMLCLSICLSFIIVYRKQKSKLITKEIIQQEHEKVIEEKTINLNETYQSLSQLKKSERFTNEELKQLAYVINEGEQRILKLIKITDTRVDSVSQGNNIITNIRQNLTQYLNLIRQIHAVKYKTQDQNATLRSRIRQTFENLTKNEEELILMLKMGFSNQEIALKNNTEPKSVNVARYRLWKKLKFNNNAEFIKYLKEI